MSVRKPQRAAGGQAPGAPKTLMGCQDTAHRGDGGAPRRRRRDKCVTFWVTEEYKDALSRYAAKHDTTVTDLIYEGLRWRLSRDGGTPPDLP